MTSEESSASLQEDQTFPGYCNYGTHERLLSDHASVDMLILDKELSNALSDLEKLGILEDDYRSLALTKEEDEEEEKVDDSDGTWPPLILPSDEGKLTKSGGGLEDESENDWEVLSSADSVWTVETFPEEATTFKDALIENPSQGQANHSLNIAGHPIIHTVPVEMMGSMPRRTDNVVDLAMLDSADVWTSIRDAIKNLAGK
ncbi:MAG: hypothetical protein SGARI_004237 [Bacillariaceae sp.]